MLRILNTLTLQKELQNFMTNTVLDKKVKTQEQQYKKSKHKNPCQSRDLNPGPLAPQSDALPLDHRDS